MPIPELLEASQLDSHPGFAAAWAAAVAATPGISQVCSGPDWSLSAHSDLMGKRQAWVVRSGEHFAALAAGPWLDDNLWVQPWEAAWSFGCPAVGPDPETAAALLGSLAEPFRRQGLPLMVGGLPSAGPLREAVAEVLGDLGRVQQPPLFTSDCLIADLAGGHEAWLGRRSPKLRAGIRRSVRLCEAEFVYWEELAPKPEELEALWPRILDVESRCWKHASGESIFQHENHLRFYRELTRRAALAGHLRLVLARREGRDLGYCFGIVAGQSYRGLQMSYDASHERLGLGVATQDRMLKTLASEGVAEADFGMDIEYKRRWCDRPLPLSGLVVG